MKKNISMKIYKTECQNCGCLFEYDKTEIVVGALKDPFTMDDLHYVECPRCKNLTKHKPIEQEEPTTAKEAFNLIKDTNAVAYIAKNAFSAYDIQKPQPKEAAHLTAAPALDTNQDERVNHPKHYQHPSGVECITVARHHDFNIGNALKYLFRAGLKQEQGVSPLDKQIEDLQKAAFYIQDEIKFLQAKHQEQ